MKNALNTNKTAANQYLNPIIHFGAKPLMILSILLTAMFILAACGGGAAPTASGGATPNPCATNPFANDSCARTHAKERAALVNTCLVDAVANTELCKAARDEVTCIVDPSPARCAEELKIYIADTTTITAVRQDREDFCEKSENVNTPSICTGVRAACTEAAPFANDLCDDEIGITSKRIKFCTMPANIWNDGCNAEGTYTGTTALRDTACVNFGTDAGAGGDADCAGRANVREDCDANPFTQTMGLTENVDLCTGTNAAGVEYEDARDACAVAGTSFDASCETQDTGSTAVKLARDTACEADGTTADGTCNIRQNIIDNCKIADPFLHKGCDTAAHILAENNKIRTTYCTTATTSFDADCTDGTDGMVNVTRANFAMACADTSSQTVGCATTYINGESGTTVAMCGADPFLSAEGCGANIAFDTIRTGICTTEATLFNPGCTDDTYTTSGGLRASLIAECAGGSAPAECTTTYVNGGTTGTSVAMCITDPFLPACVASVDDAFDSTRTDLNTLCAATGSPFDAACNIGEFGTANDASRDTFCLTIATNGDANCAGTGSSGDTTTRTTEICGATDTHNPFALLCGASNGSDRVAFCLLNGQSGNLDCSADAMVQCNRNPFGTTLGQAADVNCVTSGYAAERLALAEACRTGETPANGATCTVAINRCNADPFSDSVFNGGECDQVAFAGAQLPYCTIVGDGNAWQNDCTPLAEDNGGDNDVVKARARVCFADAVLDKGDGSPIAAGYSFFNAACNDQVDINDVMIADARETHCEVPANSWRSGCQDFVTSGDVEVQEARTSICLGNKALFVGTSATDSAFNVEEGKSLFNGLCAGRTSTAVATMGRTTLVAQTEWCTAAGGNIDNIFDVQCGALDLSGDSFAGTHAARLAACKSDTIEGLGANAPDNACFAQSDPICGDAVSTGTHPFAAICEIATQNMGHATLEASQRIYCRDTTNNAMGICTTTITNFCGPKTDPIDNAPAIFDDLCLGDEYDDAEIEYCSETASETDGNCDTVQDGDILSIKVSICDGAETTDTPYATVCGTDDTAVERQRTFCGLPGNSATSGMDCMGTIMAACDVADGDPFHVLCTAPNEGDRTTRANACLGDSATKTGDECSAEVVACNATPFGMFDSSPCSETIYANARTAFCTDDDSDNLFDTNCADLGVGAVDKIAGTLAARLKACATLAVADLPSEAPANACQTAALSGMICGTATEAGTNPYAPICADSAQNINYAVLDAAQTFYCQPAQGNLSDANCTNVTSGDWVTGNAAANSGEGLNTNPTDKSQFLVIEGNTISTTNVTTEANGEGVAPTPTPLDFSAIKYETVDLELSANSGLAFFTGFHSENGTHGTLERGYAGIFETTDLGAPLATTIDNVATWTGMLRVSDRTDAMEIDLNVTFTQGAGGFITGFFTDLDDSTTTKDLQIFGNFDTNGVLTPLSYVHYIETGGAVALNPGADNANGKLSGIIGQGGAIGVFHSNDGVDAYAGGFVVSGVCSTNIFDPDCPIDDNNNVAETAFCINTTDNGGANIFNTGCIEDVADGTIHGATDELKGLRDDACLARGDAADVSCKNREKIREACNLNVYEETTDTNAELCTGTVTDNGVEYSARQTACQNSATTFAEDWCNGGDTSVTAVNNARNSYCGDKARSESDGTGNGNCVSRLLATCTTNDGTAPFSGICGTTVTAQQITACKGTIVGLATKGADASDCNDDRLSGDICGMGNTPGTNPFAEICSNDMAIIAGFDIVTAQDTYCRESTTAQEGLNGGVCFTIKDTFCDGVHATDNPYATLCVNNSVAQESFCESHRDVDSTNMGRCTNSRATVCRVNPFTETQTTNCLADGGIYFADERAARCSDGRTISAVCDTKPISDAVCLTTGTRANPFAAFCGEGTDQRTDKTMSIAQVRQAVLTACPASNDDTGVCANTTMVRGTLRNTDCVVGQPDKLFAAGCDYTEFKPLEVNYCKTTSTAWLDRCQNDVVDTGTSVADARAMACIFNSDINTGTVAVPNTIPQSLFKSVCTGLGVTRGATVQATRSVRCGGLFTDLTGAGGDAALCVTYGASATICGTGTGGSSVAGSNPFAQLCSQSGGTVSGFDVAVAQKAFVNRCAMPTPPALPAGCSKTITGVSSETTILACINDPYIDVNNCDTDPAFLDVRTARHTLCGSNGQDGTDAFDARCSTNPNLTTDRATYCTTNIARIFDPECNGSAYGAAGATDKARAVACKASTAVHHETGNPITSGDCGDENTAGFVRSYCQTYAAADGTTCPITFASLADGECTTNPWGTGGGSACNPATYYSNRLAFCEGTGTFPSGENMAIVCRALAARTCDTGGEGATVNPFHETCYDGADDYTSKRLARCRVDNADQIAMLSTTRTCSGVGLSHVICGADSNSAGENPFAEICKTSGQNANHGNLVIAKELFCTNDRLSGGATNKGVCDTLQDNLCDTGAKSVSPDMRGAANFVCRDDDGPNVISRRNSFCEDPNTTYTDGCTNAIGADGTKVRDARIILAAACVVGGSKGATHPDCIKPVNGSSGTTVAGCSADPHHADCTSGAVATAFAEVLATRNKLCGQSTTEPTSDPFNALCEPFPSRNTERVNYCKISTNTWEDRCTAGGTLTDTGNAIQTARATECIANNVILTGNPGGTRTTAAADGMSLFNALCNGLQIAGGATVAAERIKLAEGCHTTPQTRGCSQPVNGSGATTVLACSKNPYLIADGCKDNVAFNNERRSRKAVCEAQSTAYSQLCKNLDIGNADLTPLSGRAAAQLGYCQDKGTSASEGTGQGNCASHQVGICTASGGSAPFAGICGTTVTAQQKTACEGTIANLTAKKGIASDCNDALLSGLICGTQANPNGGENPYAEICSEQTALTSGYTVAMVNIQRGALCVAIDPAGSRDNGCGSEDSGYIKAYCDTNSAAAVANHRDCSMAYDTTHQGNSVTVSVLGNLGANALNADGTALIGRNAFLSANNAESGHPKANFITGDASSITTLNLSSSGGVSADNFAVNLNDVATAADHDKYGFALGKVTFGGSVVKLYVGILADTNLGAPLNAPAQSGDWNADIRVLTKDGSELHDDQAAGVRINLTVNYTDGTIKTNDTAPTFGTSTLGKIGIAGRFTGNGLMYGNVTFGSGGTNNGSLTGLIGQTGAVGIFKSNAANTTTPYVGGFVAKPGGSSSLEGVEDDCSDTDGASPFAPDCDSPEEKDLQVQLCLDNTSIRITNFNTNCLNNERVTSLVCAPSGKRANPFNAALCTDMNTGNTLTVKKTHSLTSAPIMRREI